ncbi:MAG: ABC transporter substrate-binding protein [Desulfobacula sp.]|nr:ABC transporter substrate-binding protein [Desulfobacula sp.]
MIRLFFFIPCVLSLFVFLPGHIFAKEYSIAMITWRGETVAEKGFIDGLDNSTYDIALTKYHADQDDFQLQKIITQIQNNSVDIIYVFGTTATKAVLSRIKDIPVIFNIVSRPVGSGIIASWKSSKNNATGASNKVSEINQLKTLKKVINYKNLGIIYNPKEQNAIIQRNNVKQLENRLDFSLKEYSISQEQDILLILPQMKDKVDAVFLPADSMIKFLGKKIMEKVNEYKIPSLSSVGSMVPEDGVLLGFVPKYYELGKIAARKAVLILNGRKPSDIPSSVLDHYHISVNMKTARKINIQIPMSVLVMANQIVR